MNFKLLSNKRASSALRTYSSHSPRLFNTLFRNNNKVQYLGATNVPLRFSSTIIHHYQSCKKIPCLPYHNKPHPINFTRSISSIPPSRYYPPPPKTVKQIIALGGAALTFFIFKPTLFLLINGAVAFGTYKLLKRLLDHLFPTIDIGRNQSKLTSKSQRTQRTQRTLIIDKLYSDSTEQIKKANLNYDISRFSDPHSISSKSFVIRSNDAIGQQQNTIINIEYWAIDSFNNMKALVKVGGMLHDVDDIVIKNIEMYWPDTGQIVHIPKDLKRDWQSYQGYQSYQKPPIIEAEFRDVD